MSKINDFRQRVELVSGKINDKSFLVKREYESNCHSVTYINPYSLQIIDLSHVKKVDEIRVDGILLVWLLKVFSIKNVKRKSFDFTSDAKDIFFLSNKMGYNVSLVGGSEAENKAAVSYLEKKYPNVTFKFCRNGFFSGKKERINFVNSLKDVDVLIAGMGTPLQEEFILESKMSGNVSKFVFTCGGFITQISNGTDYYNPLFDKLNLRWLQRALTTRHVFKRLFFSYPKALYYFLAAFIKK